jgi:hypothetical protein
MKESLGIIFSSLLLVVLVRVSFNIIIILIYFIVLVKIGSIRYIVLEVYLVRSL